MKDVLLIGAGIPCEFSIMQDIIKNIDIQNSSKLLWNRNTITFRDNVPLHYKSNKIYKNKKKGKRK